MKSIRNEDEVCKYLNIPSIPVKAWDGKKSFKSGVAIVKHNDEDYSYAVATFDSEKDNKPRITKVFDIIPFRDLEKIFVVPNYMDVDGIEKWDLDESSKKAAQNVVQEAKELEKTEQPQVVAPTNEYCFDFIHNDEEAQAYIRAYNKQRGINGRVPSTHDNIVARITTIWYAENNKTKENKKK